MGSPDTPATAAAAGARDRAADLDLVRRAREGDPAAIEAFVRRMGVVRRVVVGRNARLGSPLDPQEVEDVVQEALFAIWRKLDTYEGRGALEAWAYRFAFLELAARLRRGRRLPLLAEDGLATTGGEAAAEDPDPAVREQVYRCLERLGPPESDILALKHLEGLTFEDIADRTGATANTVKSRYYRGVRRLRAMLGIETPDAAPGGRP